MKTRQHIAPILLFISLLLLVLPVIPHHHHADGRLCLKSDITTECCDHSCSKGTAACSDGDARHHHGCDNDCITMHFFEQLPGTDEDNALCLSIPCMEIPFLEIFPLLSLPQERETDRQRCTYMETLHSTFIVRVAGLRAPPFNA